MPTVSSKRPSRARPIRILRPRRASPEPCEKAALTLFDEVESASSVAVRRLAERAAARTLESFMRSLRHEMARPIGAIHSALRKLSAELEAAVIDRDASLLHVGSVTQANDRILALLDAARDVVLNQRPHFSEERLAPMVEEAHAEVTRKVEAEAPLRFVSKVSPRLALHAEHETLLVALVHVVKNAAEAYAKSAPAADVSLVARARNRGREIEIVVADRGRGMSAELVEQIFVPFGTGKPNGFGLGMFHVRKIVEEIHGGALHVESERGKGTRVRIVLPRTQAGVRKERRPTLEVFIERLERGESAALAASRA